MKNRFLFPNRFKQIGWTLFIPSLLIGIFLFIYDDEMLTDGKLEFFDALVFAFVNEDMPITHFSFIQNNILDELIGSLIIVGGLFVAFSREKQEDEFISQIRLESLAWATYINYGVLLLAIIFVYGFSFFWALVFNMFTTLTFFIIRFNWVLHFSSKLTTNEE